MPEYMINKKAQVTGEHEIHVTGCSYLPETKNQESLGNHTNCVSAVNEAKRQNPNKSVDGCYWCCNACHTR